MYLASIGHSTVSDVHKNVRLRKVARKIADLIHDDFEGHRAKGAKARPKEMTPEDFWEQLSNKALTNILDSEDPKVVQFVEYVNNQTVIDLKDKNIKKGIRWLRKTKLIHKRLLSDDIGDSD
jgi:hypothetical protein